MPDERGYFGLRLINNNVVSEGNGRDWITMGDPGYRNGKATPRLKEDARDCVHMPREYRGRMKMPLRQGPLSKSTGNMPTFDGSKGAPMRLRPEVLRRWEKTAAAKSIVQPGPRCSPPQPDFVAKRAPLPSDPDSEKELAAYDRALQARLFQKPQPPVPKYSTFSQAEPHNAFDGRGETLSEPEEQLPRLPCAPVDKYSQFSCPMMQQSLYFTPDHHEHGLAKSRKSWSIGR